MNNSNTPNPDLSLCHYFLRVLKGHVFVIYGKGIFKKMEIFIDYYATFSDINSYDILFFIWDNIPRSCLTLPLTKRLLIAAAGF